MIKNLIILVFGFLVWVAYVDDSFSAEQRTSKISFTTNIHIENKLVKDFDKNYDYLCCGCYGFKSFFNLYNLFLI